MGGIMLEAEKYENECSSRRKCTVEKTCKQSHIYLGSSAPVK
jgi:hypothetical protein